MVKGLTLSTQFLPMSLTWRLILHYSIDDDLKANVVVMVSESSLEYASKQYIQNLILESFLKELLKNGVEGDVLINILEWVKDRLNKIYTDQYNWNTTEGEHNPLYAPGGPVFQPYTGGPVFAPASGINGKSVSSLARNLPGADKIIEYPCKCEPYAHSVGNRNALYYIIMHLNDEARWTREAIADWIDKLHDSGIINAEFQSWDDNLEPSVAILENAEETK